MIKVLLVLLFSFNTYANIKFENLHTSDGKSFTQKEMNSDVRIASFFFSSCAHTCLLINAKLKSIYEKIQKNENIKIISVTVDPKYDTIKVLRKYAGKWRKDPNKWKFITGDAKNIFSVIKNEFKLPGGGMAFVHSESVIVYRNGKNVGTYSLFDDKELKKLYESLGI